MNQDIDPGMQRLIEEHPALFRGRQPAVPSHVMPGWYATLDKLCADVEALLGPDGCRAFEVRQIKEKYGSLRFYYRIDDREDVHIDILSASGRAHIVRQAQPTGDGEKDAAEARVRELVTAACAASKSLCRICGAPARLHDLGGRLATLCDPHLDEIPTKRGAQV